MKFNHLDKINETYTNHMFHAIHISIKMMVGSIKCLIHAFYPDIFEDSASSTCQKIIKFMEKRKITSE